MSHKKTKSQLAPPWHMDCLGVVAVLGLGFSKKQQQRLATKFRLTNSEGDQDTTGIFLDLHEACHNHEHLVREINKDLGKRFSETVKRVRSSSSEEVSKHQTDFPLPFIWATLSDHREDVRLEGRKCLHGFLLKALSTHGRTEQRATELQDAMEVLTKENEALREQVSGLGKKLSSLEDVSEDPMKAPFTVTAHGDGDREPAILARKVCRKQQRELRKLSHALDQERERVAALDEQFRKPGHSSAGNCSGRCALCQKANEASTEVCSGRQTSTLGSPIQGRGVLVCRGDREYPVAGNRGAACPLEKMKIAIVGGAEKTAPEYRCVVRELGGECLYHDGCTGNGVDRLRRVICRADVVVCITSINSHGAMKMAKSFCKRKGKRLLVTREAGASSLRETLQQMAV